MSIVFLEILREKVNSMFCNKCGSQTNGAQFCPNCGTATAASVSQTRMAGQKTNGMAIASLVTALVCCGPLGLIFGLISLSQINKTGEGGKGLAIAGIVVGAIGMLLGLILVMSPDFQRGFNEGYNGY